MSARNVDADTGKQPTPGKTLIRCLGYYVSIIPFGMGYFWIAINRRKQGWHAKMTHSVVVRAARGEPVRFEAEEGEPEPIVWPE